MAHKMDVMHDYDSEKLWLSHAPCTDADWPIYYAIKLEYTEEWGDEAVKQYGKYYVNLLAVSPDAVSDVEKASAKRCAGWDNMDETNPLHWCDVLLSYGTFATLGQWNGNNKNKLLSLARKELALLTITLGFKLDRQQNAMGASGWDFIQGNPLGQYAR